MDFNIVYDNCGEKDENISLKVKRAFELGYETVAINTIVSSSVFEEKKVKIPDPKEISIEGNVYGRKPKVLNRLTAIISKNIHGHHLMQCPTTKKYDILAVQPVGEKMLQHACSTLDVEIISIDLTEKLGFSLKRTYLNQAKEKGITFEIQYAPCLRDQTARRWVISNSQLLVQVLKGKNLILSSGAWKILELRGCHDVANLGNIFGLKWNMATATVFKNGELVLSHSKTRLRTGCGFVSVEEIFRLSNQNKWMIKATVVPKTVKCVSDDKTVTAAKDEEGPENKDEPEMKKMKLED